MIEIKIGSGDPRRFWRSLLLFAGFLLTLWVAYAVRDIWVPMFIALLIAMVLDPMVDRMEQRGWSRLKGAIIIYAAFFFVVGSSLAVAVPAIITQSTEITSKVGQYLPNTSNDSEVKTKLRNVLKKMGASKFVEQRVLSASTQIKAAINNTGAWVGKTAEGMISNLLWLVIVPIVSFYALKDFHVILARLLLLFPRDQRGRAEEMVSEVSEIFVRYLRGLAIVCALNAVATAAALAMFRLDYAIALGAISGLLYVVPYIGPVLTITLIAAVSVASGHTIAMTLLISGSMVVLHSIVFDYIVTPRIVGQHVGLHPIVSIIALLVGGSLLGILGMILAVPVAATIQMIVVTLFPKMGQPIEVPVGEAIQEAAIENPEIQTTSDEVLDSKILHQTIVAAVDSAEDAPQAT